MYGGSPGMFAWAVHRITCVAVLLFLLAHIIETSMLTVSRHSSSHWPVGDRAFDGGLM